MAFNANYTINSLIIPGGFVITDTSTGSDLNITDRRIYLYQASNELVGGNYIDWPLAEGTIKTLNVLQVDLCLRIVLMFISSAPLPPPSEYTKEGLYNFTGNSWQFVDSLLEVPASDYTVTSDTNFVSNFNNVFGEIKRSERAAATGQQMAAQAALSRIQYMIVNQNNLF